MPILNLKVENDCQQAIKDYLERNASDVLAEKINNGVEIEKDGKMVVLTDGGRTSNYTKWLKYTIITINIHCTTEHSGILFNYGIFNSVVMTTHGS